MNEQYVGNWSSEGDVSKSTKIPPRPIRNGSVCPLCDGDAEESGTPGQINCFSCGYIGPAAEK